MWFFNWYSTAFGLHIDSKSSKKYLFNIYIHVPAPKPATLKGCWFSMYVSQLLNMKSWKKTNKCSPNLSTSTNKIMDFHRVIVTACGPCLGDLYMTRMTLGGNYVEVRTDWCWRICERKSKLMSRIVTPCTYDMIGHEENWETTEYPLL